MGENSSCSSTRTSLMVKFTSTVALLLPLISADDQVEPCTTIESVGDIIEEYLGATFRGEASADPSATSNTDPSSNGITDYPDYGEEIEETGSGEEGTERTFSDDKIANFLVDYYQYAGGTPDSELVDPLQDRETNRNFRLLKYIVQKAREDDDPERIPSKLLQTVCIKAHDKLMSGDMRAVNCMTTNASGNCVIDFFLEPVANYGCWCYLGNSITEGKGPIQDGLDQLCKDMQLCLRCARMDNAGCDPVSQTYAVGYSLMPLSSGVTADCTTNNPGNACAADICCCEQDFLAGLLGTLFASQLTGAAGWNSALMHVGTSVTLVSGSTHTGAFDPDVTCPNTGGGGGAALDCCGIKPDRFPFSTTNKSCCGNELLYNTAVEVCCDSTSTPSYATPTIPVTGLVPHHTTMFLKHSG